MENLLAHTGWSRVQLGAVLALLQRANRMLSCAQLFFPPATVLAYGH